MARDRLAAMRAQRQGGQPGTPYDGGNVEMGNLRQPDYISNGNGSTTGGAASAGDPTAAFFNEVSAIRASIEQLEGNVSRISGLHAQLLNNTDESAMQQTEAVMDELVGETRGLTAQIKSRIADLQKQPVPAGQNVAIRTNQVKLLREKFIEALQNYQRVEQEYRKKYRERVERQFRIVKPDATPEEVKAVVDNDNGQQIFSQALMSHTRYDVGRAAYREVQERHEEILKIENTLAELAQLFNDMSLLVEQQDEIINTVDTQAAKVQDDVEQGLNQTGKAVESARRARRMRWICFFIFLFIVAVLAIVLGVVFGRK